MTEPADQLELELDQDEDDDEPGEPEEELSWDEWVRSLPQGVQ